MARNIRRRRLAAAVGAVFAAVLVPAAPAQARPAADGHAATQSALNAFQVETGLGAGVYAGGGTGSWNLTTGTGLANANRPVQPTDHFRAGSQTKTFTAAVVMQLVDEGKVSLDAPIERYLPGVVGGNGYDGNVITVRHLLQHTSGIPESLVNVPQQSTYTLAELVRQGLAHPPAAAPGTTVIYSNANYQILGMLIERITRVQVGEAITIRIIGPLGLNRTYFPVAGARALPDPYVHGYRVLRLGPTVFWTDVTSDFEPSLLSSAGAVVSTEQDLTTFYQALVGGKVVSQASLAEMSKMWEVGQGPGTGVGLGLQAGPLPCGGLALGHNGIVNGYMSLTVVTADGRHASVMTNSGAFNSQASAIKKMYKVADAALCETS
ncbi:serine hydrolase domain-containing protein [Streptomyces hesseae]|uniref:Serine hydrolase domain-containing protein n=1 Tax=Streptomyces hesseae TaxID=3075519 RepID=A0ABU2SI35_9ACTN|nr:serine hydrolase domain-containing protein [Streptomyces sp. DSM 40473]MDT0448585.1 serine hydrolase domain-containing protein [Streptomyces sp. DSM 40473]